MVMQENVSGPILNGASFLTIAPAMMIQNVHQALKVLEKRLVHALGSGVGMIMRDSMVPVLLEKSSGAVRRYQRSKIQKC